MTALAATARALLDARDGGGARAADRAAAGAAREIARAHGGAAAAEAAAALGALAGHVGVPRDMAKEPARALRAEAGLLASALQRESAGVTVVA